jgi:hypothetical protein
MFNLSEIVDQRIQNLIHKISAEKNIPASEIRVILKLNPETGRTQAWASHESGKVIRTIGLKEV